MVAGRVVDAVDYAHGLSYCLYAWLVCWWNGGYVVEGN